MLCWLFTIVVLVMFLWEAKVRDQLILCCHYRMKLKLFSDKYCVCNTYICNPTLDLALLNVKQQQMSPKFHCNLLFYVKWDSYLPGHPSTKYICQHFVCSLFNNVQGAISNIYYISFYNAVFDQSLVVYQVFKKLRVFFLRIMVYIYIWAIKET